MSPQEFNFVPAAEKAIADLRDEAAALRKEVQDARKAARKGRIWNTILSVVTVVTLAVTILGVRLYYGQRAATSQLRQQAIISCTIGNDRAAGTVTALDELVLLLEGPRPTAKVQQEAAVYDAFVLAHNPQRNCVQAYGTSP